MDRIVRTCTSGVVSIEQVEVHEEFKSRLPEAIVGIVVNIKDGWPFSLSNARILLHIRSGST
jgi:hypothetical protein